MSEAKANELEERLLDFAVRIGKLVDSLPDTRMGKHIAGQLIRAGTAPAPNYGEACGAESKNDFIHKMGIVFKELRESRIWIRMVIKSELLPVKRMNAVLDECEQLCNIIGKSLLTAKTNRSKRND